MVIDVSKFTDRVRRVVVYDLDGTAYIDGFFPAGLEPPLAIEAQENRPPFELIDLNERAVFYRVIGTDVATAQEESHAITDPATEPFRGIELDTTVADEIAEPPADGGATPRAD